MLFLINIQSVLSCKLIFMLGINNCIYIMIAVSHNYM